MKQNRNAQRPYAYSFLGDVDTLEKEIKNQLFPPRGELHHISVGAFRAIVA